MELKLLKYCMWNLVFIIYVYFAPIYIEES